MTINFLPGNPESSLTSVCYANWHSLDILSYCSGNNLIIIIKNFQFLQTIYLDADCSCCDINKHNGKIAITVADKVFIYRPDVQNYFDFKFNGNGKNLGLLNVRWELEMTIINDLDHSKINCINWSANCDLKNSEDSDDEDDSKTRKDAPEEFNTETNSELIVGSDKSLSFWRLFYKNKSSPTNKKLHPKLLWFKEQPSPIYLVKISPDSGLIASCGKFDKLVKIWKRLSFGIENAEFDLNYLKHSHFITNFRWKLTNDDSTDLPKDQSEISNSVYSSLSTPSLSSTNSKEVNTLYTLTTDSIVRIWSSFELDNKHFTQFNGALDLFENGGREFCTSGSNKTTEDFRFFAVMDNSVVNFCLNKMIDNLIVEQEQLLRNGKNFSSRRGSGSSITSYLQDKELKLTKLLNQSIELCFVIDKAGSVLLYAIENLSINPPKLAKIIKLNKENNINDLSLGPNCFPKHAKYLSFQDFVISSHYNSVTEETDNYINLIVHDLEKGSIRHIEFTLNEIFDSMFTVNDTSDNNSAFSDSTVNSFLSNSHRNGNGYYLSRNQNNYKTEHNRDFIGTLQHKFTGHNKSIKRLIRSNDGSSLLSLTRFSESFLWCPIKLGNTKRSKHHSSKHKSHHLQCNDAISGNTLSRKSVIKTSAPILDAIILNKNAEKVASLVTNINYKPLSFILLPEVSNNTKNIYHVVSIYSKKEIKSWEIEIGDSHKATAIRNFEIDSLPSEQEDILRISPIDPVGWNNTIDYEDSNLYKYDIKSSIQRPVLSIIDNKGNLRIYSMNIVGGNRIEWILKSLTRTNIKNCKFFRGSTLNKIAVVDESSKKLFIWDSMTKLLEYEEEFDAIIQDLDWTCTNTDFRSILAVGFQSRVLLYTQLRYDYTNESPSYGPIRSIDVSEATSHNIGDSIWLEDGTLVIGSGNQFFVIDKSIDVSKDFLSQRAIGSKQIISDDIFSLCSVLNGPLPIFHPQFLIQSLFLEKHEIVKKILVLLNEKLRSVELDPDGDILTDINSTLGIDIDKLTIEFSDNNDISDSGFQNHKLKKQNYQSLFIDGKNDGEDHKIFDKNLAFSLIEKLQKMKLPFLTRHQQITLVSVIETVLDIDINYKKILDSNGLRYYLGMKLFQLNATKIKNDHSLISIRDINFALHSGNKDILLNIVNEISHFELNWLTTKKLGLVYWLSNGKLVEIFEKIAKFEFLKSSERFKDPSKCSIFYLALKKKQILIGLWKTATGHPEQQKMVKFLSNDFKERRWKTAASKNAFALMGKHRYIEAACFFLLGDSLKDCCNVLIRQVKDLQLAIGVSRCYEGNDEGAVFKDILTSYLLPISIRDNDRWLRSLIYHMLGQRENSIQCLISDEEEVEEEIEEENDDDEEEEEHTSLRKSFLEYDPVLIVLYKNLRLQGVSSPNEYKFILKIISIYNRMGCDLLSLYIVKNWKFKYDFMGQSNNNNLKKISSHTFQTPSTTVPNNSTNTTPSNQEQKIGSGFEKKKFVEPPSSLEFDMGAFEF
ncbi:hypothetical protein PACTADRAFT_48833 [Pachysolen tannophilus NRRL Y-2460]|uniref:RAVE complex protein Rav1 C-terminal domain-containing protein n=1 Tax=Pachysolen tannophilus NRRL Y-2460 TaxID=669874 RepID=A0A1E4TZ99_PACTA|nr:hypothetical protein PACTADRAFT_48833 [Pachysolen tannophilus NRRL Y-2460]